MNRAELKENARNSLKDRYKDAIIMMIIMWVISFVAGFIVGILGVALGFGEDAIDLISQIVGLVISGFLTFGYTSYFLKVSRNENATYQELFSKTKMFVPYILISLLTGLFVLLWSFLFIIPGIIASIGYSMVLFVALDNPELSASEVLTKSKEMMNGHKMDYFVLQLSFLGWAILGIFTFGILYLWLIPYMEVTNANFYNRLKEQNK